MRSMPLPARPVLARRAARAAAWLLLALAVLLGHGLLLHLLRPSPAEPAMQAGDRPAAPLQVRALSLPPPPRVAAVGEPAIAPAPRRPAAPKPLAPPVVVAAQAEPVPQPEPAAPAGAAELPVYATRLPDSTALHYRLQRGQELGAGRLQWQRDGDHYQLRLDVDWPGRPAQGSASRGQIDAEGVAPLRHAELRRAREQRAVNFQRDAARITFSGPQAVYPLPPGAQDRLSWMIQLPAILEADAALTRAGAVVTLFVAGTRGDAEAWRFEVLGHEALSLPAGAVAQALQLRREPTRPYDTRVEVWLDPARQHLPVRVVFTTLPGGQPLQLELAALDRSLENDAGVPR
jgi:hypothetical protein